MVVKRGARLILGVEEHLGVEERSSAKSPPANFRSFCFPGGTYRAHSNAFNKVGAATCENGPGWLVSLSKRVHCNLFRSEQIHYCVALYIINNHLIE